MNTENKITFESFTERVAKRADVSATEADAYIHQLARTAGDALEKGEDVQLHRFGRFHTEHIEERAGHNPRTGEEVTTPEHTRVEFRPYKALLIAVNWPFRKLRTRMLPNKDTDTRSTAGTWLILALALLVLIPVGLYVNNRMSDPASDTAASTTAPANTETVPVNTKAEPSAIQGASLVPATVSDTTADTTTDQTADTADTAADTTAAAPAEPAGTTDFVVEAGDTLWGIATSQWGDSSWWPVIYAENRADMAGNNPDLIETGSTLRLPELTGSAAQPTDADLRRKAEAYRVVADAYAQSGDARADEYRLFVDRRFAAL